MADSPLHVSQIDYSRHQRLFNALAGRDCPIKILDAEGKLVWGPEESLDAELGRLLVATPGAEEAGVNRLDLPAGTAAFHLPLRSPEGETWGWIAALARADEVDERPLEGERLAEALEDIARGLATELGLNAELTQIAGVLAESYEELHLVYALDQHIRSGASPGSDQFVNMLQATAEHLNADVVTYVHPGENACVHATSLSQPIDNLDLVLVEMRGDLFRFIQASGESVVLNETDDPRRAYIFTDMPYRILACPIRTARMVDAEVVMLRHLYKPPFSNSDRHLGEAMANQLANMSKSALLLHRLNTFTAQLAETLVEAVEAKDPYTRGHSERVNVLSMEIGKALGLPEDELQDLHWGSLLHDVGKIGIPDAVLCKPSRLTKDEYTFIMVHPERSYEILRNVAELQGALPGLRHHQEMYDGKGYPHGLKGVKIPLHARIMAVADTYDSITSSRAYRAGRSHELAMAEIERVSGTQLDPAIVETFKKICAGEPAWMARFNIRRESSATS